MLCHIYIGPNPRRYVSQSLLMPYIDNQVQTVNVQARVLPVKSQSWMQGFSRALIINFTHLFFEILTKSLSTIVSHTVAQFRN